MFSDVTVSLCESSQVTESQRESLKAPPAQDSPRRIGVAATTDSIRASGLVEGTELIPRKESQMLQTTSMIFTAGTEHGKS